MIPEGNLQRNILLVLTIFYFHYSSGLKVLKNYKPNLDTDKWLRNRQNNSYRQHERKAAPIRFPPQVSCNSNISLENIRDNSDFLQEPASEDIITVENIHHYVDKPRGPDVFTVNVESALNFSGRK